MRAVLVTGPRDWDATLCNRVYQTLPMLQPSFVLVGDAIGADHYATMWCRVHGVPFQTLTADWNELGRKAGHLRNGALIEALLHRPEPFKQVVGFPNVGCVGTLNCMEQARRKGLPVMEVCW